MACARNTSADSCTRTAKHYNILYLNSHGTSVRSAGKLPHEVITAASASVKQTAFSKETRGKKTRVRRPITAETTRLAPDSQSFQELQAGNVNGPEEVLCKLSKRWSVLKSSLLQQSA